ncbi:UPF0405 family protein [Heterostelium album PN500]|uniref:UPF0405 family protein n=1 Tax=Heterostelium pallidum (strain ATCC 26659 / Pp 5 / PN500) TaxID=670386 RepID=D3BET0_HETP5|nr:UPF0405 family protein [Heterostelium album PN500]EFA80411.1 UPF0405 family protein [Heterostelium album PN500]|eukprot:XP_020432531.1 UPF0405 family protein [Heterostelium album PN500]
MDLFSHLNWYRGNNVDGTPMKAVPSSKLILIADTLGAEGSFVIHDVLQSVSKRDDMGVCLVGLNQSLFHYHSVGRKLGYNLTTENQKGHFSFINGLGSSYSWIEQLAAAAREEAGIEEEPPLDPISKGFQPFPIQPLPANSSSNNNTNKSDKSQFFKQLFELLVKDHQQRMKKLQNSHTLFVIDNLNLLSSFGASDIDVLHFIQFCQSYVKEQANCSLLLLYHSDCTDDETFLRLLQYESDLTLMVDGLKTGYSRDIDGQIDFLQKREDNTLQRLSAIHYQVLDNSIRYFSMGSRIQ